MKKYLYLLLSVAALLLTGCRFPNQNDAFYDIRIGVILPLSGENKEHGKAALDAVEMAVREANRKGGVNFRKIQLVIKNSGGDSDKAAEIAEEMIENDNIVAFIGAYSTAEAVQLKLAAEKYGVPFIASMASYEKLTEHTDYTFQCAMNDEFQGAALASYLVYNRRANKVAIMFNTGKGAIYQRAIALRTMQALADFSSIEAVRLTYQSDEKSFEKQIRQCIREDVEIIVLPEYAKTARRFILEARRLGFKGGFAGCDSFDDKLLTSSSENLGVCFFSTPYYAENGSEENIKFKALMKKNYKRTPAFADAMGYDSMQMLIKALESAYSPDSIAMNLKNMRSFRSVCGSLSYHPQKELLLHPVYIVGFSGGGAPVRLLQKVDAERLKNYRNREED